MSESVNGGNLERRPDTKLLPVIDPDNCSGCNACVEACDDLCIELIDRVAVLTKPELCNSKGRCVDECHDEAMKMDWVAST